MTASSLLREFRTRWFALIAFSLVIAFGVLVIGFAVSGKKPSDLGGSLVDAAIDVLLVGFLGTVLTGAINEQSTKREDRRRNDEEERDERRRLNAYRLRLLLDVVSAYNQTKAARRFLRAAGLLDLPGSRLEAWQIDAYWKQLAVIDQAQLDIEKVNRELEVDLGELTDLDGIKERIRAVEGYLGLIITGSEVHGAGVGRGLSSAIQTQKELLAFLRKREDGGDFETCVSDRLKEVERFIRDDMKKSAPANQSVPAPGP